MKNCLLTLFILLCFISCNPKNDPTDSPRRAVTLEKLDSIRIYHLGNPIVHDIDPVSERVLFMENNANFRGEEIFVADFDGNILTSFIKDGDTRDTYGYLMAPLVMDGEGSFMAYAFDGFMRYNFDGNLISQLKIIDIEVPNSRRMMMGGGLQKLEDKFLYMNMVSRDINHGAKDFFDSYHTMSLLDPNTGRKEAIIPLPKTSIFRQGKFFFSDAWQPAFYAENDKLFIVFGLEPVIYVYENQHPFTLLSSIPMELPVYRYFKGANEYNNRDIRFFGHRRSSGMVHNIKKINDHFLIAYFPGYDAGDTEASFSSNIQPEFWDRMREKYPDRLAILDAKGEVVDDFVPDEFWPRTMLMQNGELWMLGRSNEEVELDYFQLFKVGLKVDE